MGRICCKAIGSMEMKVHDAIKRQELTLFKNAAKTVTVKAKKQTGNHWSQAKCARKAYSSLCKKWEDNRF